MALASKMMGGGLSAGQAKAINGNYAALTAAGSSQATATAVTASMCVVASADGTKAVRLPAGEVGDEVRIFNNSGSTLPVYPHVGGAIAVVGTGLGSANAAFSQLTYKDTTYKLVTSTQWLANTSA
jgi:hypothetical protein